MATEIKFLSFIFTSLRAESLFSFYIGIFVHISQNFIIQSKLQVTIEVRIFPYLCQIKNSLIDSIFSRQRSTCIKSIFVCVGFLEQTLLFCWTKNPVFFLLPLIDWIHSETINTIQDFSIQSELWNRRVSSIRGLLGHSWWLRHGDIHKSMIFLSKSQRRKWR